MEKPSTPSRVDRLIMGEHQVILCILLRDCKVQRPLGGGGGDTHRIDRL